MAWTIPAPTPIQDEREVAAVILCSMQDQGAPPPRREDMAHCTIQFKEVFERMVNVFVLQKRPSHGFVDGPKQQTWAYYNSQIKKEAPHISKARLQGNLGPLLLSEKSEDTALGQQRDRVRYIRLLKLLDKFKNRIKLDRLTDGKYVIHTTSFHPFHYDPDNTLIGIGASSTPADPVNIPDTWGNTPFVPLKVRDDESFPSTQSSVFPPRRHTYSPSTIERFLSF
ncbi:uncharacterized protein FSUBG_6276 [Fusarium subglutinans]|uniref:Uncharacterized protein n=1 Tax=Gibberella subglutinans TaxID=42677 RepID=A0A8H5PZD4_GIBSU|nr:uncharacterized protein FSUBG_6276 [Fusarium subglutinans]KAF5605940.1 hypothetical protein FSUBG_6276 [Fusarium subglutinans]